MPGYSQSQAQDESIYNLIPKPTVEQQKPARYNSKFREDVRREAKEVKRDHRTMGFAKEAVPKTNEFLKAHEKEQRLPEPKMESKFRERKPLVPDQKEDKPMQGVRTKKNFISQNAVDAIMTVPQKPQPKLTDTRNGNTFPLDASGLVPVYSKSKGYGELPGYIKDRKEEWSKARAEYEAYMTEYFKKGAMRTMSEEDRTSILNGLKQNWDDLHHQFQSLSVVTDTIPKRIKKEKLVNEMKLLEKDIELLSRHQLIYIAD